MLEKEQHFFSDNGVVVLRGLFKDWIDLLKEGVAYNEDHPSEWFRDYTTENQQGRFWADYCNWLNIPAFKKFIQESPAAWVAQTLMQSDEVRIFHEHVLVKNAGSKNITPWHHDAPYYPVHAQQTLSLWIPLDPVGLDSTIEFVAGSHKWGEHYTPQSFTGEYYKHDASHTKKLPDIEKNRDQYQILSWALEPGDAIAFDYLTVHGAPGNMSPDKSRRVVSFRWLGDEAIYVDRGGKTSPPYPHLIGKLKTGDSLPGDEFPIILTTQN